MTLVLKLDLDTKACMCVLKIKSLASAVHLKRYRQNSTVITTYTHGNRKQSVLISLLICPDCSYSLGRDHIATCVKKVQNWGRGGAGRTLFL